MRKTENKEQTERKLKSRQESKVNKEILHDKLKNRKREKKKVVLRGIGL